jgi:hypothetical protein
MASPEVVAARLGGRAASEAPAEAEARVVLLEAPGQVGAAGLAEVPADVAGRGVRVVVAQAVVAGEPAGWMPGPTPAV